ncbi:MULTISPECIES: heavy metal sensor histidine kinase [Pseudomonas]|uniref:heavy metal sensor histidine kinase n=1 Tax=Pseudomonas TaxID=286 RepID=UPI000F7967D5|nr:MULTISPECIES: heavy metal sensor histidine kinase [Pseudomonas]RRW40538.1 HAMP domain-containing protein [Pseudomonas luteola]
MISTSLSFRLSLKVILLGAMLVMLVVGLSYITLDRELDLSAHENLTGKFERIEHNLKVDVTPEQLSNKPHALLDLILGHDNLSLSILDADQAPAVMLGIGQYALAPEIRTLAVGTSIAFHSWLSATNQEMLTVSKVIPTQDGQLVKALLTLDRSADRHLLLAFLKSSLVSVPVLLILIGISAWLLVQKELRPLRRFRSVAAQISTQSLSHRIKTDRLPRELKDLAHSMNFMLHRLDTGVQQLSEFSDDLAHELRSPINNLMIKTQVTLSRKRSEAEYCHVLESAIEEYERLNRIISDMLFLAQVSHPHTLIPFTPIFLRDETMRIMDLFAISAEDKDISISIRGEASTMGDRLMIQRALSNLLSNAIGHTPYGGTVAIVLTEEADEASVTVENTGAGIGAHHLPHLFERFYRVDGRRTHEQGGTGLGLAIVRSIMSLHQGRCEVESIPGHVTRFRLIFPIGQVRASSLTPTHDVF